MKHAGGSPTARNRVMPYPYKPVEPGSLYLTPEQVEAGGRCLGHAD